MSGYSAGGELREPLVTEDLGLLAVQARDADSSIDGGVWASDAAADDGLSGDSGDGGGADFWVGVIKLRKALELINYVSSQSENNI